MNILSKIKINPEKALSVGVGIGSLVLGVLKWKNDENQKAKEKNEIVEEVLKKISEKND